MPTVPFRIASLTQRVDDSLSVAEALRIAEVSRLDVDGSRARERVRKEVTKLLKKSPTEDLYKRRVVGDVQVGSVRVTVPSPSRNEQWRTPVKLQFEYVYWLNGKEAAIAYVPEFGIDVIVNELRSLEAQVANEIRSTLTRLRATRSLQTLVRFGRRHNLKVRTSTLTLDVPTPKQLAERDVSGDQSESVLREVATKQTKMLHTPVYERDELIVRLAELLVEPQPQSVLLVGDSGVGKTAIAAEVARRRDKLGLGNRTFWATSGARLVAGMSGFGMWQQRCQDLVEEARKSQSIVNLGNLIELLEVGKSIGQQQGIASFLRPLIARGDLLVVAECTREQLGVVEREDPQLLGSFTKLEVDVPSDEQTRSILLAASVAVPAALGKTKRDRKQASRTRQRLSASTPIEPEAIDTLDRLHRRFATYSSPPGRPLRFLRNLLDDNKSIDPLNSSDVTEAFSRETGLPRFVIDDDVPFNMADALHWFTSRVIGQAEPVELVVDLIATIKAGLSRPDRPIASLLFVGPTGVGKTEMAKALTEYLYQDAERLVRIDMSEYADATAVDRLIGGTGNSEGLLTRKIREQPFTVVLLDEFEKADPRLFDLLLQVLGEGRLTDTSGRVADFRNSVIILTSNLGAEGFKSSSLGFGESVSSHAAADYFTRQAREFLRPEMFNRLDRIVPFLPLDTTTIASIANRELEKVRQRDGIRYRDISLNIDDQVVEALTNQGHHPQYGARPLKRQIEQQVVGPLARRMNEYAAILPLSAKFQMDDKRIAVQVKAAERDWDSLDATQRAVEAIEELSKLRRNAQKLEVGATVLRLRNEVYRLQQQIKRRKRQQSTQYDTANERRAHELEEIVRRVETVLADVVSFEDNALFDFYQSDKVDIGEIKLATAATHDTLNTLLTDIQLDGVDRQSQVTVCIFGECKPYVAALARSYEAMATRRSWSMNRYHLKPYRPELDDSLPAVQRLNRNKLNHATRPSLTLLTRKQSEEDQRKKIVDAFAVSGGDGWLTLAEDTIGVALQISGEAAFALLEPEQGAHEFVTATASQRCLVESSAGLLVKYDPSIGVDRRSNFRSHPLRRRYDLEKRIAFDERSETNLPWTGSVFDEVVLNAIEQLWNKKAWSILDE